MDMSNGTEGVGRFSPARVCLRPKQGMFPEGCVRRVYPNPLIGWIFHSKYVRPRKGLKAYINLDTSELAFFCRLIPKWLWVGSLVALTWG